MADLRRIVRVECFALLAWAALASSSPQVVFEDTFGPDSRGALAPNPVLTPPPEGMGYESNVPDGYELRRWIVADAEANGPRRAFWVIPRDREGNVADYAEQAGRSRNSIAFAGTPLPAGARRYVIEFRQWAHDNDTIGFALGATSPVVDHDGVEISYQRQLPGTDETVPDIYYRSPWGEGRIAGKAALYEWAQHRIEVNGNHLRWSQNGEALLAGSIDRELLGGWFGIRQRYERGTRYDDVRITVLERDPHGSHSGSAQ